ncbi:hypothetical protein THTE_2421 [Thermogutta terrifontis]|uniref:Uncharacterized protein n=1 Tax=Thermogutta terrifontis TaxID=1331910 RepID=A0A286RGD6_9BACT|nr:hypothetical protein THTE_2421 [Thermogutta terrifontis]
MCDLFSRLGAKHPARLYGFFRGHRGVINPMTLMSSFLQFGDSAVFDL